MQDKIDTIKIENEDGTVDIILPKPPKKQHGSFTKDKNKMSEKSWTEKYKTIVNEDGTVDIILPKPPKKQHGSFRIENYQLDFLREHFNRSNISDSLRSALDELIKLKTNTDNIIYITNVK